MRIAVLFVPNALTTGTWNLLEDVPARLNIFKWTLESYRFTADKFIEAIKCTLGKCSTEENVHDEIFMISIKYHVQIVMHISHADDDYFKCFLVPNTSIFRLWFEAAKKIFSQSSQFKSLAQTDYGSIKMSFK